MTDNYKSGISNDEESKKNEVKIDFSKSIEKLEEVKSKSTFRELNILCEEIIDFYKKKQTMLDEHLPIEKEKPKFLYQISQKTERLLIEAIYMENKENQKMKIRKIYNWYFENLKRNKDLRKITERTEKDWFQEEEEEPPKEEPEKLEDIKKHRSYIGGFDSAKKRLTEYRTKKINNSKKVNQISFQDENINFYGKAFGYNTMTNFKSIKDMNTPNYIATSQQSTKYGTFYNKGKSKPEINTGTDWFSKTGLDFKKEIKESYSYIRPPYEYEFLYLENKILQQKQKELAEKRNVEEIDKGVLEHGFKKSFYKGAINEKTEMKEMIQKYKELLEIKRIEEEKRKKEEEKKRKIEEEKLRKELEKKRQIAMSKIRQIRKPDPDRKKKKIIIIDNKEDKNEIEENENKLNLNEELNTENADIKNTVGETNNVNNINEDNNDEVENENSNEIEELNKEEEILRIDIDNIKYINPYMSEEDINNPNPFLKTPEMKEVNFYEIKYKKKSIKLRELAIECQYNNLKEKQLELDTNSENDNNKEAQKVKVPSNLSAYYLFSDKIFLRRNLGRQLNSFNELDMPKNRYQESISPLSFYDNKHKKFRESSLKKEKPITLTDNFALKTFYNYKDNYLQIRKTLSAHKEKAFKNTLLYKNSKPKYKIKLDTMVIMPNDKNKFPIYYLPFQKQNSLLPGPKDKKNEKKGKKEKK
jgi:hypothetical protein